MPTIYLRGANTSAQWYQNRYSGSTFSRLDKFLIHTTETGGWPGYSSGASAPNATYYPKFRQIRQHFGINRSARALRDPSSTVVRENRDNVFQLEIICYSDYALARSRGGIWVGDLTDSHMRDIAAIILQIHRDWRLPIQSSVTWREGRTTWYDNVRLSGPQFDAYRGILGHVHASGNTHWDPGGFRYSKLVKALNYQLVNHPVYGGGTTIPDPTVPGGFDPEEDDMPAPRDWTDSDWDAVRKNLLMADLSRNTGNAAQMSDWAEGEWPDNLGTLVAQLLGYDAVYSRRAALASEEAVGPAEFQSPGVAEYARDVLGWVDPNDATKARALPSRYLLEHTFAMAHQMRAAQEKAFKALSEGISELLGADSANSMSKDEWKTFLDERLAAAFAENVVQVDVDVSVQRPEPGDET